MFWIMNGIWTELEKVQWVVQCLNYHSTVTRWLLNNQNLNIPLFRHFFVKWSDQVIWWTFRIRDILDHKTETFCSLYRPPFKNRKCFDHMNTRLVLYSNCFFGWNVVPTFWSQNCGYQLDDFHQNHHCCLWNRVSTTIVILKRVIRDLWIQKREIVEDTIRNCG